MNRKIQTCYKLSALEKAELQYHMRQELNGSKEQSNSETVKPTAKPMTLSNSALAKVVNSDPDMIKEHIYSEAKTQKAFVYFDSFYSWSNLSKSCILFGFFIGMICMYLQITVISTIILAVFFSMINFLIILFGFDIERKPVKILLCAIYILLIAVVLYNMGSNHFHTMDNCKLISQIIMVNCPLMTFSFGKNVYYHDLYLIVMMIYAPVLLLNAFFLFVVGTSLLLFFYVIIAVLIALIIVAIIGLINWMFEK